MNKFFKNNKDFSIETKKWKTAVETLMERLDRRNVKVDGAIKRADSFEATLKRVSVENINLEAIRGSQVEEIRKLKATLETIEEEMKEVDKKRVKVAVVKTIEDFQISTDFLAKNLPSP